MLSEGEKMTPPIGHPQSRDSNIVDCGYSLAHANHFACVPSSHSSVQPFNLPSTARPAISQCDSVSRSTNGLDEWLSSLASVTSLGFSLLSLPGGEAIGRYAAALFVGPYHKATRGRPSIVS